MKLVPALSAYEKDFKVDAGNRPNTVICAEGLYTVGKL